MRSAQPYVPPRTLISVESTGRPTEGVDLTVLARKSSRASPAHEFFGSRKLRLAPQDYSPWTPPVDRLSGRSYPPASRHPRVLDWSAPITECSVILSEASLRAESKDPHLVASSAWVADPSQAHVILSEASLRAESKDPQLVGSSAWVADPSQAQDDSQPVEDPKRTGRCTLARI